MAVPRKALTLDQELDNHNWEISVGVTFASFMSAVTLFFAGVVIAQYKSFDPSIRVPLLFLIISTFSFIFSASIYSNAGLEVTARKPKLVRKYLVYANSLLEFFGLYLFVLATPLVIGAITADEFLRIATIAVASIGLFAYSQSNFSILHRELRHHALKLLFGTTVAALSMGLYFTQFFAALFDATLLYNSLATVLLLVIGGAATYFCRNSHQYEA